jgi:hypothetical protein
MKQRWLPGFNYPDVDSPEPDPDTAGGVHEEREAALAEVLPGQRGLFTFERELVGLIEAALADGRSTRGNWARSMWSATRASGIAPCPSS